MFKEVRYAARVLLRQPGFALVAVVTLALGIGANTAIFSVIDAALLRSLPYSEPSRLVHLWETKRSRDFEQREASYPDFLDWRAQATSLAGMEMVHGLDRAVALRCGGGVSSAFTGATKAGPTARGGGSWRWC